MAVNILVCIKRVPVTGAKIVLTEDGQTINTRNLGFAMSPHEECAVEEAIRLVEQHGGSATVLTLGAEVAIEELRYALAMGIDNAMLLETDGSDWGPAATARAISDAISAQKDEGVAFDILLFGNESADSGGYQVGIRVAHALDLPCVSGVKALEIEGHTAVAKREAVGGMEVYEVGLPAVFAVKEGINLPRFRTMPGRLRAKKQAIKQSEPQKHADGLQKVRLRVPEESGNEVEILGEGKAATPRIVEILQELGLG